MRYSIQVMLLMTLLVSRGLSAFEVIAHRGASGYLPEHTLEALVLAYAQGADYIEQDLVVTKDGKLVVLHDIHLETVTNVEQVYPQRKRQDGRYYALDFTLAELLKLDVHERTDQNNKPVFPQRFGAQLPFKIATFESHLNTIMELNRQFGKSVGIYPEIKSPAWHKAQGVDISHMLLTLLRDYQLDTPQSRVYVQCFDFDEIKRLRNDMGAKVKLIQLIGDNSWAESDSDYDYLQTPQGINEIAKVADGIGPWLPQVIDPQTKQPSGLTQRAHDAGLLVHPYTFRMEQVPQGVKAAQFLQQLTQQAKVDGLFTDFTDFVVQQLQANQVSNQRQ